MGINPIEQINKGQDAGRQADIQEIKKGLELYYQDNNCYPLQAQMDTVIAGASWIVGSSIYINKMPKDASGEAYTYMTDQDPACPQWAVVFANAARAGARSPLCPLESLTACTPINFDSTFACVISGSVDCSKISTYSL